MSSNSSEDLSGQFQDLFTQDGVLLKSSLGRPIKDIAECNVVGMLCIVQDKDTAKFVEWRPNDVITVDSDIQDQEWAVVNTVARRQRTFSGNMTSDYAAARARVIQVPFAELKSFKVSRNSQQMQFSTKPGAWQHTFYFQHGNAEIFVAALKNYIKTAKSRHERNVYLVVEQSTECQALNRSFAELDIFTENTTDVVWNLMTNLRQRPYETTMEAFSKLTDIVYYGNEETNGKRDVSEEVADLLSKSMSALEDATVTRSSEEYEVVNVKPTLPPRFLMPRGGSLTKEKWIGLQDTDGRVNEVDGVKQLIFRGGVEHSIRKSVWKYLLDYSKWNMSHSELKTIQEKKRAEYFIMKFQWQSITEGQESRFSDFRDRKSLVEKDVNRTDRTHPFFAGDGNANLVTLQDILMTYVMYNFDLGYVQGMSDVLAPLLVLFEDEVDSFWCFVGFMEKIARNFDLDQSGMKLQLRQLQILLGLASPELLRHLEEKESANMYFCFRWLLVWFKREFSFPHIMKLWEVLWTQLPCQNFHLLICVAILDMEKDVFIGHDFGFTDILRHVNDLSMSLDVDKILSTAEGIYHQLIAASHLTDEVRLILGIPTVGLPEPEASGQTTEEKEEKTKDPDMEEVMYQRGLDMNF